MPIAIIAIPGSVALRHDQINELVKSPKSAAYGKLERCGVVLACAEKQSTTSFPRRP